MKIEQFPYLSPEAMELRRRDGIPPWGVHPCELDSVGEPSHSGPFFESWLQATALREELEAEQATGSK